MDESILKMVEEQGRKLDEIRRSVETMRKFFMWTLIITVALFVLPLVGLIFVIPQFLSIYGSLGNF